MKIIYLAELQVGAIRHLSFSMICGKRQAQEAEEV